MIAALALSAAGAASAQYGPPPPYAGGPIGGLSTRPHLYFGIEAQGFFILKQVSDQTGYMGQGGGGNVFVGWRFGPMLSLELNVGSTYHDETLGRMRTINSLFLVTPTVDVKFHFSTKGRFQPYVQLGAGYAYLGATYATDFACDLGCDTTFAQGPLFQLGGGFDYWATPWISIGGRLLYRAASLNESPYGGTVGARGASNFVNGVVLGINAMFHFF